MADLLGLQIPDINITGFLSTSWIYILIIGILGIITIGAIGFLLFYKTFNIKIVLLENLSGFGYRPVLKTRARTITLGKSGASVLKTLFGGMYLSSTGRKMGKNTFWFCREPDGCIYNAILGELDTDSGFLDIEPIDRDVRMFQIALDRLSEQKYGRKAGFIEKYGVHILLFFFLGALILGMGYIIGKIGEATQALASTAETNKEVIKSLASVLQGADNIQTAANSAASSTSGLVPVGT